MTESIKEEQNTEPLTYEGKSLAAMAQEAGMNPLVFIEQTLGFLIAFAQYQPNNEDKGMYVEMETGTGS